MKIRDYKKEQELLGQLDALKQIKDISSQYDEYYEAAKKYVSLAWDGALGEEAEKHVGHLVDIHEELNTVVQEIAETLRLTKSLFKMTSEEKKNMRASQNNITENIGTIMKDLLHDNGLIEGEISFPRFGNVKCSLKTEVVITDEQQLKESLVKEGRWDMIKTESLTKLKKIADLGKLNGIEEQEIPKVTVTSRK